MNSIQPYALLSLLFVCALSLGCIPSNESHVFEIGRQYQLAEFTLTFPSGKSFVCTKAELQKLDEVWNSGVVGIDTINQIMRNGTRVDYHLTLSDGFETEFQGNILKVADEHYLYLGLLGDGGGFPGDVIPHVIKLDNVTDDDRLGELIELTKQP